MVALLVATVGISVEQIYCYCVGKTTYSIFDEAVDACAADRVLLPGDDCCKVEPPPCCAVESALQSDSHDCTKKSTTVYLLKAEFLVNQPFDKALDFPIWADEFPEYLRLFRPVICEAVISNKAPPPPPPPLSGRTICLRHVIFLC